MLYEVITYERTFVFELEGRFVLVFANYSKEKIKSIVERVQKKCMESLNKKEKVYFCVGESSKNVKGISKSYRQAVDGLSYNFV